MPRALKSAHVAPNAMPLRLGDRHECATGLLHLFYALEMPSRTYRAAPTRNAGHSRRRTKARQLISVQFRLGQLRLMLPITEGASDVDGDEVQIYYALRAVAKIYVIYFIFTAVYI